MSRALFLRARPRIHLFETLVFKLMARGVAREAPSPPLPTDATALPITHSSAHTSTTTTTTTAAAEDDDATGNRTREAAARATSTAIDDDSTQDAELQTQQLRVPRKPRMTLEAVEAILAGENPSAVLPPPPMPAPRKPPLTKAPLAPVPTRKPPVKKRRGRDVPGVEWDESLFHFANCVRIELGELNAEFVANDEITFAAFKKLWRLRRISAAFHVEFWESSPSTTHQTILQMALDLLVCCVEEQSPFESQHAVAALFGFVFALFSAYSVQLGTPKHKIDVDPRSWTALLAIESAAVTGLGSLLFPQAVREVLAMLKALEHRENAFLKCLRGFGHQFRAKSGRLAAEKQKAAERCRLSVCGLAPSDLETLLKQEQVEQLNHLSKLYSDSVALINAKSSTDGAMASAVASLTKPRLGKLGSKHAPVTELSQTHEKSRAELLTRLHSYLELKADSTASRLLQFQQHQAQEQEQKRLPVVDSKHSEHAESEVVTDDDFDFEFEEEPVLMEFQSSEEASGINSSARTRVAKAAATYQQQPRAKNPQRAKRTPSGFHMSSPSVASSESDDLALLEAELSRDVYNIPPPPELLSPARASRPQRASYAKGSLSRVAPPPLPSRKRRRSFASTSSAFTVDSEAASDGLVELEAELKASVLVQETKTAVATGRPSAARNRQTASDSDSYSDSGSGSDDGLAELEAELEAEVGAVKPKPKAKAKKPQTTRKATGPRQLRVAPAKRRRLQDTISIATESDDGLAALQAELAIFIAVPEAVGSKPKVKRATRATAKKQLVPGEAVITPVKRAKPAVRGIAMQQTRRKSTNNVLDMVSIATESGDGLAELQAELELSVHEATSAAASVTLATLKSTVRTTHNNTKTESVVPSGIASRGIVTRRMRAASIVTESDDGALAELQAELERTAGGDEANEPPPVAVEPVRSTRTSSLKRRHEAQSVEAAAIEQQEALEPPLTTEKPPRATRARAQSKKPEPRAATKKPRGIAQKRMRKVSDALSIATTETDDDDGSLTELQAELERSVGVEEPKSVATEAEVAESATQPKTGSRQTNSKQASADGPEVRGEEAPAATRQSLRKRPAAAAAAAASDKEPTPAVTSTTRATRASRSSVAHQATSAEAASSSAAARKTPTASLGKPLTGKAKGKAKAVAAAKKSAVSKTKSVGNSSSSKGQKREPEAKVQASDSVAIPTPTSTESATTKPEAARRASTVSIASTSDGNESDDGLGELEAELQASLA